MSTALERYDDVKDVAEVFVKAGLFNDIKSQTQAMVKIMAGREIGLGPFAAMTAFDIIEGKVEMSANTQAMLIKRHEHYDYRVKELDNDHCLIEFFQDGESVGFSPFSMDDAKRIGLAGRQTWQKYPRNLLFARALTNGVAWFCPDVADVRLYGEGEISGEEPQTFESPLPNPDGNVPAEVAYVDVETGEIIEDSVDEGADLNGSTDEPDAGAGGASSPTSVPAQDSEDIPLLIPAQMKRIRVLQAKLGWTDQELRDYAEVDSMANCSYTRAIEVINQMSDLERDQQKANA